MFRTLLSNRTLVPILLCLQVLPLLVFPASSYSSTSQEWWLPAFLTLLAVISLVQILFRKSRASWPWYMLSFAQGFNIISRLMMLLSHATVNVQGVQQFNTAYNVIAVAAMLFSAFEIWYGDLPEVRSRMSAA
jgi:hypothetical protein